MQVAGKVCAICGRSIQVATEATWCAACCAVFHTECLNQARNICPGCKKEYDAPESHFAFSRCCPECFRPVSGPQARCLACCARTCWDTSDEYERFVQHMRLTALSCFTRGCVQIGLGILCLFALIFILLQLKPAVIGPALLLLGFMLLTLDGLGNVLKSKRLMKFR